MSETELKAPFAGTVAEIAPVAGEQVVAGAVVVRLADLSAWQIETDDLTELDVVKVKAGAPASLTFDALPGVQLTGKVVQSQAYRREEAGRDDLYRRHPARQSRGPAPLEYDRYGDDRVTEGERCAPLRFASRDVSMNSGPAWFAGLSITHTELRARRF